MKSPGARLSCLLELWSYWTLALLLLGRHIGIDEKINDIYSFAHIPY